MCRSIQTELQMKRQTGFSCKALPIQQYPLSVDRWQQKVTALLIHPLKDHFTT